MLLFIAIDALHDTPYPTVNSGVIINITNNAINLCFCQYSHYYGHCATFVSTYIYALLQY